MTTTRMSPEELNSMLIEKGRSITVIDVRSKERYDAGHVPGALHIPVETIQTELPDLPKDHLLVTY